MKSRHEPAGLPLRKLGAITCLTGLWLAGAMALSGCGQRGPLVLPKPPEPPATTRPERARAVEAANPAATQNR